MPKPEWGVKRSCASCGARFYDLKNDPIICPECGATYGVEALTKARRGRAAVEQTDIEKDLETEDADIEDDTVLDDDQDDDAVETPTAAAGEDEDEDDTLEGDDAVLLEDEDEDDEDLGDFGEAADDDDRR